MASINEKLNYINETKSLIKDKLNDLGSEIEDETTFRDYAEKIEDLYEEWPKISDEDTTISLNNTKKGKMNLQLKGNLNQNLENPQNINIVTGNNTITIQNKNLLFISDRTGSSAGISYEIKNGVIIFNGTATGNGALYISINKTFVEKEYFKYIEEGSGTGINKPMQWKRDGSTKYIFNAQFNPGDILAQIYFTWAKGATVNNYKLKSQLEKGTSFTGYETPHKQTYEISLGEIELVQINSIEDYFYKNNNNWYKKPMILKVSNYNGETISTDYVSTTGDLTTGATVYYINPNADPEGIKITDTTLISQLNMLEQALSYNNQTNISQTNDNLPFIINATALMKNSD